VKKLIFFSIFFPVFCFGQWVQYGNSINGQVANDKCGWSTAISSDGNVVAMGSTNSSAGGSNSGQVRVFGFSNGAWAQIGASLNGESSGDQTGQSVSLSSSGSIVAIGEPFNNDLGFTSGQVRVFKNNNNNWVQVGQDLYGENASAEMGKSVDLSADGSVVAFGAPNTTVNAAFFTGRVKVFVMQNNTWVQKGGNLDGDGTMIKFGSSVSLSDNGNIIAIGHTGNPIITQNDTGKVRVYQFVANQWVQMGNTIRGTTKMDEFGHKVSLSSSGNIVAIGTFGKNEVKVYELINNVWTQIGNTLVGETTGDAFGYALSLSGNGSKIAIGGRFNSIDGTSRGRAYVYERKGSAWTLVNSPILGIANSEQTGFSVALTTDGSKVAVGALNSSSFANNAGQVRVYKMFSTVGMDEVEDIDLIKFYPNPAKEVLTIQSKEAITSVKIFSIDGRLVEQKDILSQTEFSINTQQLNSGMYILSLQSQTKNASLRIVKE
jgi:hypothetical protein